MKPQRIYAQVDRNGVVQVDRDVMPDLDLDVVGNERNSMVLGELYHFICYFTRVCGRGSYGELGRELPNVVLKLIVVHICRKSPDSNINHRRK